MNRFVPPSLEDVLLLNSQNTQPIALSPSAIQMNPTSNGTTPIPPSPVSTPSQPSPVAPIIPKSYENRSLLSWIEELERFKLNEVSSFFYSFLTN